MITPSPSPIHVVAGGAKPIAYPHRIGGHRRQLFCDTNHSLGTFGSGVQARLHGVRKTMIKELDHMTSTQPTTPPAKDVTSRSGATW